MLQGAVFRVRGFADRTGSRRLQVSPVTNSRSAAIAVSHRVMGWVSARSLGLPVGFVDLPGQTCCVPGGVGLRFPDRVEVTPQGLHLLCG